MFDIMARGNKKKKVNIESGNLSIFDLPDDVLQHMMSFLSSREIMKTSVLSKQCKHLWKYVPTIRVIDETIKDCKNFLDNLLIARSHTLVNLCDFYFYECYRDDNDDLNIWVFHVLLVFQLQELIVGIDFQDDFLCLDNLPIISKYLRRLQLDNLKLEARTVDFSGCPVLEDLDLTLCCINAKKIASKSLKRLATRLCSFCGGNTRTIIYAPSLVTLELVDVSGRTPSLDWMPSLVDAHVEFDNDHKVPWWCCEDSCIGCSLIDCDKDFSLLLDGLSTASHLKLKNESEMFIFDRNARRCPIFRNLRILILNEWFLGSGHGELVRILHHTPVLEELIFLVSKVPDQMVELEGANNQNEQPIVLKCLNEVKIKCEDAHEGVNEIVNILPNFGIPREKIFVEEGSISS